METPAKRHPPYFLAVVLGALTSLPVIALSYLGSKLADLPFVPFDAFDFLARVLPGNVITAGIDTMVNLIVSLGLGSISGTAKQFEQSMGIVLVIVGGGVLGVAIMLFSQRVKRSGQSIGTTLGLIAFLIVAAIEFLLKTSIAANPAGSLLWLALLFGGWGMLLGAWLSAPELAATNASTVSPDLSRRTFLFKIIGSSIAGAIVVTGIGRYLDLQRQATGSGQALSSLQPPAPTATPATPAESIPVSGAPAPNAQAAPTPPSSPIGGAAPTVTAQRIAPAPGTRPELTANQDFYRIDIDTLPSVVDKATWKLQVKGLFDKPRALTFSDLLAYPSVTQPITIGCISNPVAGDLISTSNWVGVRLGDVLKDLGIRPQAKALAITAADDFYESVPMQELFDPRTLLVYGMNGETLPIEHGFPLRIYIPNHYGMKQPKWITSIEALDHDGHGYWVDRGWSPTANPQIVSVIDTVAKDQVQNGRVPIGGIAWAGDRQIKKVELQVDKGPWNEATLRVPTLSPLTWVQWRYDWTLVRGQHTFIVRAYDGNGILQTEDVADTYPDGATGYHSVTTSF